jgi:Putative antitoxin
MHISCMATKTISLELDAYEKLRSSKRPGESFSDVVRRAVFRQTAPTGKELLTWFHQGGSGASDHFLKLVEMADSHDTPPDNPWR